MCRGHDPLFFQATWRSLAYQFTIIGPLLCPPFSNFRKIFNFQPCYGQNFSSQDANFPNFRSLNPSFFKENPLPRPYFWKPVWHTPTKKKSWVPPPPPPPPGLRLSKNRGTGRPKFTVFWMVACTDRSKHLIYPQSQKSCVYVRPNACVVVSAISRNTFQR